MLHHLSRGNTCIMAKIDVTLLLMICPLLSPMPVKGSFNLTIIHTNDVHARVEQINKYGAACRLKDEAAGACYGGVARRFTMVKKLRAKDPEALLLDAGDEYQGTMWYTYYRGNATAHFMNLLEYTAMSFGNHEFDDGVNGLVNFLRTVTFPIITCNIDDSEEPTIQGLYKPSIVIEKRGQKIGIIGYVSKETSSLSNPGQLRFLDEVECITKEAKKLVANGVKIIIALGHSGFDVDKTMAAKLKDVDIIVGGHTHTFLYTGKVPSIETAESEYPTVVTQVSGRKVLVVQDYSFGKYLGYLRVTFDDKGEIESWRGNPILLDKNIDENASVKSEVKIWKQPVDLASNVTVGSTLVFLQGDRTVCRIKECNMGNFITDAVLYQNKRQAGSVSWENVQAVLINSGGMRTSFNPGVITMGDILTVFPTRDTIGYIRLKGAVLLQILEHSVSEIHRVAGRFLQVSGMQITYDMSKPVGQRVAEVWVMCITCQFPELKPLNKTTEYSIIMTSYLINGGDGYSMIKPNLLKHHNVGTLLTDTLVEYLRQRSPVLAVTERRIMFQTAVKPATCEGITLTPNAILFVQLSTFLAIFALN